MTPSGPYLFLAHLVLPAVNSFLPHCHISPLCGVKRSRAFVTPEPTNSGGDEADDYSAVGSDSGLGDLTGGMETTMDYLPNFTPLERIAITVCIGNRQPISSDSRGRIASVAQ